MKNFKVIASSSIAKTQGVRVWLIGTCRCEGCGFLSVETGMGFKNHRVLVWIRKNKNCIGKQFNGMRKMVMGRVSLQGSKNEGVMW